MFNRYHDDRSKTYLTNITSQITMPWNRPCCSYKLETFREYAQICFRKSQKISGSQLKPFGRYLRKTQRVDKNNPPPATNRVNRQNFALGQLYQSTVLISNYNFNVEVENTMLNRVTISLSFRESRKYPIDGSGMTFIISIL